MTLTKNNRAFLLVNVINQHNKIWHTSIHITASVIKILCSEVLHLTSVDLNLKHLGFCAYRVANQQVISATFHSSDNLCFKGFHIVTYRE